MNEGGDSHIILRAHLCIFNYNPFTLNIQKNETIVKGLIGDADNA